MPDLQVAMEGSKATDLKAHATTSPADKVCLVKRDGDLLKIRTVCICFVQRFTRLQLRCAFATDPITA